MAAIAVREIRALNSAAFGWNDWIFRARNAIFITPQIESGGTIFLFAPDFGAVYRAYHPRENRAVDSFPFSNRTSARRKELQLLLIYPPQWHRGVKNFYWRRLGLGIKYGEYYAFYLCPFTWVRRSSLICNTPVSMSFEGTSLHGWLVTSKQV